MRIWVTSDTHFNHKNIIQYCNRPFENVEIMNEEIIKRWNEVVASDDIVIHCGDFALGPNTDLERLIHSLNGHKILIRGNHDHASAGRFKAAGFEKVYDKPVCIAGYWFMHHPHLDIYAANGETNHYYFGHVHEKMCDMDGRVNAICACVDRTNFYPIEIVDPSAQLVAELERIIDGRNN